jgi:hypothetical protein
VGSFEGGSKIWGFIKVGNVLTIARLLVSQGVSSMELVTKN